MKKFLKALGITALAAAVIPCKVEKDELTGVKTYQSLLSRLRVGPGKDGTGTDIRVDMLGGIIPAAMGKAESEDYADDELEMDFIDDDLEDEEDGEGPVVEINLTVSKDAPEATEEPEPPEEPEEPEPPETTEEPKAPAVEL